jgi:hypothetical protein
LFISNFFLVGRHELMRLVFALDILTCNLFKSIAEKSQRAFRLFVANNWRFLSSHKNETFLENTGTQLHYFAFCQLAVGDRDKQVLFPFHLNV